jgi:hypothetical protein
MNVDGYTQHFVLKKWDLLPPAEGGEHGTVELVCSQLGGRARFHYLHIVPYHCHSHGGRTLIYICACSCRIPGRDPEPVGAYSDQDTRLIEVADQMTQAAAGLNRIGIERREGE